MKKYRIKKGRMFVNILVVVILVTIFSKGTKPHMKEGEQYINQNLYNYLMDEGNQRDVYEAAIKLNQGSSENTCVYFLSEVLRRNNFKVPNETKNTAGIIALLKEKGWEKQSNYEGLKPGDICFTTDGKGEEIGFPTHTYVFMKWVKKGNYDYAYICDNQAKDYKDKVYHIRNIKVIAKANGSDKDAFAFFMKKT